MQMVECWVHFRSIEMKKGTKCMDSKEGVEGVSKIMRKLALAVQGTSGILQTFWSIIQDCVRQTG